MNLLLTSDGDIDFSNNNFSMVDGVKEIEQMLYVNLRTFQGEWFLDTTLGVPYFQSIFIKNPNIADVDSLIKNAIVNTQSASDGVDQITAFNSVYDPKARTYSVTFTVTLKSGASVTITDLKPAAINPNEDSIGYTHRFFTTSDMMAYTGQPGDTAIDLSNPGQRWIWSDELNTWTPQI